MNKKRLIVALLVVLLLSGCGTVSEPTSAPAVSRELTTAPAPTSTTQPIESDTVVTTESPTEILEVPEFTAPPGPYFKIYMAFSTVFFETFSMAPVGTEDWHELEWTYYWGEPSYCTSEVNHGYPFGVSEYGFPYDGDATLWRVKAENIPEKLADIFGGEPSDYAYTCTIYEDIEVSDTPVLLRWIQNTNKEWAQSTSEGTIQLSVEELVQCPECPESWFESSNGD